MTKHLTRRRFAFLLVATLAAGPAFAASITDSIIGQLQSQGFTHFTVGRTWLGRIRIVATNDVYQREIIVDGRTGEILRDLTTNLAGDPVTGQISGGSGSGSGSGSGNSGSGGNPGSGGGGDDDHGGDDDDGDDDGDDEGDDGEDDDGGNSGSGSGGSGSGSGGGGSGSGGGEDDDD